jgi:TolB protein
MTSASAKPSENRGDATQERRYQSAQAHMQRGEWADAIRELEQLAAEHPEMPALAATLDEARMRAAFDANTRVKPKRYAYAWQRTLVRAALVLVILFGLWQVSTLVVRATGQMLNASRAAAELAALRASASEYLKGGDWDRAEAQYRQLLAHAELPAEMRVEVETALAQIAAERELEKQYWEIVAIQEGGDCTTTLLRFGELMVRRSNYKDVDQRIDACARSLKVTELFAVAQTHDSLGLTDSALDYYQQIYALDASYERDVVTGRIVDIELGMGEALLANPPISSDQLAAARDRFSAVLKLQPRHPQASEELRLANAYVDGKAAAARGAWDRALRLLRPAYEVRPQYLGAALVPPLYDAYIGLGDEQQAAEDCALAYEMYRKAAELPVADRTVAEARMAQSAACLTPTPTITPTPPPTGTPAPEATATPTPTPLPLASFRSKIVFKSDNPELPGFYAMNPDGSGRQYIGPLEGRLQTQFEQLVEQYRVSPDGQYSIYVGRVDGRAQVVLRVPPSPIYGAQPDKPVTRLSEMAYDPAWSPDGAWIAFVTQENESDDIWLVRPDSTEQKALMRNDWEWDKHPTWSPDSSRIAFFSNREGTKGIYVMDVNGQAVRNISNVPWDEYDPLWIR